MPSPRRLLLLVVGCVVLGVGVGMLLTADLGSDGYSTLVNGIARRSGVSFFVVNTTVSVLLVVVAAARRVRPGIGTIVQVLLVGLTVDVLLDVLEPPDTLVGRIALLAAAIPVLAVGVAGYLGSQTGAGPVEAFALAYDPPVPFRWSYSIVQGGGALVGWLLGATIGTGTIAVIVALGPCVDLAARMLRVDVHQGRAKPTRS